MKRIHKITTEIFDVELKNIQSIEITLFANNEGFDDVYDLFRKYNMDFKGYIIHFTDFRY